jgi:hypothetical protein
MIRLDAATVLLQWATGGLAFLWVTTRRRLVGLGYGWLLRGIFAVLAIGAAVAGRAVHPNAVRDGAAIAAAVAALAVTGVAIARRRAGVGGQREVAERRRARVAGMTGAPGANQSTQPAAGREFPPTLDLIAPAIGLVGLIAAGLADAGAHGPAALAVTRTLTGAALMGAATDAMLLGHWYLVQPGLPRAPLEELTRWVAYVWPFEVVALLWPTGIGSVLSGRIKDGYGGLLGWFWVACAVTTLALCFVTRAALKERAYSAVMAATGLLYLAILTAFGTDLVARALLAR